MIYFVENDEKIWKFIEIYWRAIFKHLILRPTNWNYADNVLVNKEFHFPIVIT